MKKSKNILLALAGILLVGVVAFTGFVFAVSPAAIRTPAYEHAHLRMQLVVNGEPVNFGDKKYQETYEKGQCSAALTATPIHLHDNVNQFAHLHWKDMTGGLVLKYYGWDLIGGPDGILGYRVDKFPNIEKVSIYSEVLPAFPEDARLWVYTGTADEYDEHTQEEFLAEDLETFFGKESTVNTETASFLDKMFPRAYAQEGDQNSEDVTDAKELERIHNLLGNVVIFAQKDEPAGQQVKERFQNLEPLTESVCGG